MITHARADTFQGDVVRYEDFFSFADLGVGKQKTGFSFVLFLFAVEKKSFSLCPLLEKKVNLLCLGVASQALMLFESV